MISKDVKIFIKTLISKRHYLALKKLYRYCLSLFYLGSKLECPFCKIKLNKFLPNNVSKEVTNFVENNSIIGYGFRENCWGPRWLSTERERLIYLYLLNFTNVFTASIKLLHFAPEPNLEIILKNASNISYVSTDLFSDSVMITMDTCDILFKDNVFEVILCSYVLDHVFRDQQAISELYRVLKPGGWALLAVPISRTLINPCELPTTANKEERLKSFGDGDLVRVYGGDFNGRLRQSGFLVEEFNWENYQDKFGGDSNRFGLMKEQTLFIAKKPQ